MLNYNLIKVNNGLNLFVIKRPSFGSVDLTLYIKTGSAFENKSNNGISHLLEHLLFYSRKKLKLYPFGTEINASTRKDFTCYEALISKKYIQEILNSFQKIVFEPNFNPNNLKIIKGIVKEEIDERKDDSYDILNNQIDNHLYPKTSISLPVLGSKANIDNLTLNDLKSWYQEFYQPENMIFTVVGNVSVNEVKNWVENYFKIPRINTKKQDYIINTELQTKNKELIINKKKFERNYLALVYPATEIFGTDFMNYIFLHELINQKLRPVIESSDLFYDMDFNYFSDLFRGEYQVTVSSNPNNVNKIKKMIIEIIENMNFSKKFFQKTKDYFINNLILKKDSLNNLSLLTIYLLISSNKIIKIEDEIKQVEKISLSQIKKVKNNIFKEINRYSYILK